MTATNLSGRVALVTGAGTGIGRAVAEALAAAGALVGLHHHGSVEGARQALSAIEEKGGRAVLLRADLADPAQSSRLVEELVAQTGRLDILINNAGSPVSRVRIEDCSLELWQQILTVNLTSAFLVTRCAIPLLRASGNGAIVNNLTLSIQ